MDRHHAIMYTEHLYIWFITPHISIQDGGTMVLHYQGRSLRYPQNRNGFQNPSDCDSDNQCPSLDFNLFSADHTVIMTELPQFYDDHNRVESRIQPLAI
jgi:hypothetical protein